MDKCLCRKLTEIDHLRTREWQARRHNQYFLNTRSPPPPWPNLYCPDLGRHALNPSEKRSHGRLAGFVFRLHLLFDLRGASGMCGAPVPFQAGRLLAEVCTCPPAIPHRARRGRRPSVRGAAEELRAAGSPDGGLHLFLSIDAFPDPGVFFRNTSQPMRLRGK